MVLSPAAAAAAASAAATTTTTLLIKSYKERRVANFIHTVLARAGFTHQPQPPASVVTLLWKKSVRVQLPR